MADCNPQSVSQSIPMHEDDAFICDLRNKSPEACTAFYRRYAPALYRFILVRLAGDTQSAEDVLAQTFIDATRNINRFDAQKSPLSAWLFGIARRHIHIEHRKQHRQKSIPTAMQVPIEAVSEVADTDDLASRVSSRLDAQRQFAMLSAALSDKELEVLILQEVEQLSLKEIGKIIGRSERAVHSLLHRAKQKARNTLAVR